MGKEEIARDEQFLLFPQCFLINQIIVSPFVNIFDIISLFAAELQEPKIGMSGKGLDSNLIIRIIPNFFVDKESADTNNVFFFYNAQGGNRNQINVTVYTLYTCHGMSKRLNGG